MFDNPWILGSPTFGGNPLACSAFISTIRYMLENDIPGQSKAKGDYYLEGLKKLQEKRIALGHKPDDHEQQWPDITM